MIRRAFTPRKDELQIAFTRFQLLIVNDCKRVQLHGHSTFTQIAGSVVF